MLRWGLLQLTELESLFCTCLLLITSMLLKRVQFPGTAHQHPILQKQIFNLDCKIKQKITVTITFY